MVSSMQRRTFEQPPDHSGLALNKKGIAADESRALAPAHAIIYGNKWNGVWSPGSDGSTR